MVDDQSKQTKAGVVKSELNHPLRELRGELMAKAATYVQNDNLLPPEEFWYFSLLFLFI